MGNYWIAPLLHSVSDTFWDVWFSRHASQQCSLFKTTKLFVWLTKYAKNTGRLSSYCTVMHYTLWIVRHTVNRAITVLIEGAAIYVNTHCYLGRRHPDANIFRRLEQRLRETGNITPTALVSGKRPRIIRISAKEDAIIAAAKRQPFSLWETAREMGLSQPLLYCHKMHITMRGERVCFQMTVLYG
jgi:hypothetical protein